MKAYYVDNPEESVSLETIESLGVLYRAIDMTVYNEKLAEICKQRNYNYRDEVNSEKIPDFDKKIAFFAEEHLHDDEEIRFFLSGNGFFDVRNQFVEPERWIRVVCGVGDLLILPAGIYHRFVVDPANPKFHVIRLFCGDPVWTPWNRVKPDTEERASRKAYFEKYLAPHIQAKGDAIKKRKVDDEAANTTAAVEAK